VLRQVGDNKELSGVIVRIDSPGGDAFASDEILREMKLLSKKKPMVIAFSNLAASGGYYMAMTGDPIVAYPGTITGSIGVFYGKLNLRGLYNKLGMNKEAVQRGQNALIDSDYQPMTPESERKLREAIDATYDAFLSRVSEGRKRSKEQIRTVAEGRVWLGSQAKANGLVDEIGGMDKAIDMIKQRAKIAAGDAVSIIQYPPRRSFFDALMHRSAWSRPAVTIDPAFQKLVRQLHVPVWQPGGIMRLMPYSIEFR
jgi:protease IV